MNEADIVLKALVERRSCKKYQDKLVPVDDVKKIIDAGLNAASGMDRQPVIILAVTNPKIVKELEDINGEIAQRTVPQFYGAKQVLVVLANKMAPTYVYDGSLALGNMMTAAEALGISACWIHRAKETFELPKWKEFLKEQGIEGDYEGIGNLVIGYDAGGKKKDAPRKPNRVYWIE